MRFTCLRNEINDDLNECGGYRKNVHNIFMIKIMVLVFTGRFCSLSKIRLNIFRVVKDLIFGVYPEAV